MTSVALLVFILHLLSFHSQATLTANVTNTSDIYIAFVTQWKPEECYGDKSPNCFNTSITSNITIHGEWPDFYNSTSYPEDCTKQQLQQSDIAPIQSQMQLLWPTYDDYDTNFGFWSHEWSKHGTCWFTKTPLTFFQQGLMYYDKYDIESALLKGGIVPGQTYYSHDDVDKTLQEAFGQRCVIGCEDEKYIVSFQVCVDWNGNGVDCPDKLSTNCASEVILSDGSRE